MERNVTWIHCRCCCCFFFFYFIVASVRSLNAWMIYFRTSVRCMWPRFFCEWLHLNNDVCWIASLVFTEIKLDSKYSKNLNATISTMCTLCDTGIASNYAVDHMLIDAIFEMSNKNRMSHLITGRPSAGLSWVGERRTKIFVSFGWGQGQRRRRGNILSEEEHEIHVSAERMTDSIEISATFRLLVTTYYAYGSYCFAFKSDQLINTSISTGKILWHKLITFSHYDTSSSPNCTVPLSAREMILSCSVQLRECRWRSKYWREHRQSNAYITLPKQ